MRDEPRNAGEMLALVRHKIKSCPRTLVIAEGGVTGQDLALTYLAIKMRIGQRFWSIMEDAELEDIVREVY
jgi:hypothetical protein